MFFGEFAGHLLFHKKISKFLGTLSLPDFPDSLSLQAAHWQAALACLSAVVSQDHTAWNRDVQNLTRAVYGGLYEIVRSLIPFIVEWYHLLTSINHLLTTINHEWLPLIVVNSG